MADYSEAIEKGVFNWLDANKEFILKIIHTAIIKSTENAIEALTAGVMTKIGRFLDENKNDLTAAIAMAIAASWQARQHPVPIVEKHA